MKLNRFVLLIILLSACTYANAQKTNKLLYLRSGTIPVEANISPSSIDAFNAKAGRIRQKMLAVLQFDSIPGEATRKILAANGIELLEYIPDHAYTASISGNVRPELLRQAKARALIQLTPQQKMDPALASGVYPSWAVKTPGTVDVWISFPKSVNGSDVVKSIKDLNIEIISTDYLPYRVLALRIAASRIRDLADQPYIEYVQTAPPAHRSLNFNSRANSGANYLNASIADGGKGLDGEGVTVGIGDDANVHDNIDFAGRIIDRSVGSIYSGHGFHVTGTVAGAGNGNELYRGYAPKARIVSQYFSGIISNADAYVRDYGMVITNNSYGDNWGCGYYGTYDLYSRIIDQMAYDLPELQNVFAAGNSGSGFVTCSPYPAGFHTVFSGFQAAKNVLTVGATDQFGNIGIISSRGPVMDGRTKPEITAMGEWVASSWWGNQYSYSSGTSQAAPAVSGGLALMYQRYKQLNGGSNPKSALMKAILCNGANDKGNSGPDFSYGFGSMNLLRSIDMIENHRYVSGSSANGSADNFAINVPVNTARLKVMLYWNDPAASALSSNALVNDLDLTVSDPSTGVTLPKVLNGAVVNVQDPATNGEDHINNMEQVVIDQPAAGNYTIHVKGTAITENPSQDYFVVYDIVPNELKVTSPAGSEPLAPSTWENDMIKIIWEANGFSSGTGTIEFSADNGSTWSNVATGVDINNKLYNWWVPDTVTSQARIRITKDGTGESAVSNAFTIIGQPNVSLSAVQCEGYMNVAWTSVKGAEDYVVMMVKNGAMAPIAITNGNNYSIGGLSKDSIYWVTVCARVNGKPGRRTKAVARVPADGNCTGSISDNDLKLDAIVAPVSGRMFTASQLGSSAAVQVRIKNLDDAPVSNFDVQYSINGGAWVTEHVSTTIAALGTYTYTFASTADLSATGQYAITAVVKNGIADPVTANDTAYTVVKNIDNQPLDLSSKFLDDFENATPDVYQRDTMGLAGIERYDYNHSSLLGRIRSFVNSGIAYSGDKALTMDIAYPNYPGVNNYLTGTYNLVKYKADSNDLRLDFVFNSHGYIPDPNNKVWIRGNESNPWIEAYDLDKNRTDAGTYKKTESIQLSDILAANGQNFTPGFQVRWGQNGIYPATDRFNFSGYTFDDVQLYEVFNDFQMMSIDTPTVVSCGLTTATPVKISVRNNDNSSLSNIPVKYRINGGLWRTETISSIPGNTTIQYSFATTADLSALGTYSIDAVIDYPGDNFRDNDTTSSTVINQPVINSFPYLENFESGSGYWYTSGRHVSWEYGTPASAKINRAASGARAWKTRLAGNYNDNELSYLYSPCFNISGMTQPTLSFNVALDLEDCGTTLCDGAWVEYSADGKTWQKLGASGSGTNWYTKSDSQLWSINDYTRWHVATYQLPAGLSNLRIRFVMQSDPYTNYEGIAIDDIHIYDNIYGIYGGPTMTTPVSQTVSGNNWIDFTSGGKLVASLQPNNQDLGTTNVQAYINTGAVRNDGAQFYLDRNITIKPQFRSLTDSVAVRFYFLDSESDSLIKTSTAGCSTCSKPSSICEVGVSKYSDTDTSLENGTINDNKQNAWYYLVPADVVKVPFDKGYYAEFKVKSFSEFWINNGGSNGSTSLPVELLSFTARKRDNNDVLLNWKTTRETSASRYEIELARGNQELSSSHFTKIGEVSVRGDGAGVQEYSFTDKEGGKSGPRYYRLKMIDNNGSFKYSETHSVLFGENAQWQIYPNPSDGLFHFVFQINEDQLLSAQVIDVKGSLVKEYHIAGTGFLQKLSIDLSANMYASGVYLLQTEVSGKKQSFKLYKSK